MLPWITEYNTSQPHCALGRTAPLCRLASFKAQMMTTRTDTVDLKPSFVGLAGVKPREATAKGGSDLTPDRTTKAKSASEENNLPGSYI